MGKGSEPDDRRVKLSNALTSVKGRIYAGLVVVGLAMFELYGYWRTGNPMLILFAILMLALVANEGFQIYRHRNDPAWPPKLKQVPRNFEDASEHDA
ncbi:hypothetical protein ACTJJE_04995 [Mycolicibacterium sp. 22603]|uniref:hypothetical protein n=1 Tax=Mycolicibacterium sp. 22603 TaxID=3453950 RepID=UPI003F83651C